MLKSGLQVFASIIEVLSKVEIIPNLSILIFLNNFEIAALNSSNNFVKLYLRQNKINYQNLENSKSVLVLKFTEHYFECLPDASEIIKLMIKSL